MFWAPFYKNTPFGFWVCKHKVDNKPVSSENPVFLMSSFKCRTKQQWLETCYDMDGDIVTDAEGWSAGVPPSVLHTCSLYEQAALQDLNIP